MRWSVRVEVEAVDLESALDRVLAMCETAGDVDATMFVTSIRAVPSWVDPDPGDDRVIPW